mgnify:CR=1 FL=1
MSGVFVGCEWWDAVLQMRLAWALFVCCYQPLCVVSQQSWFWAFFCFINFPILLFVIFIEISFVSPHHPPDRIHKGQRRTFQPGDGRLRPVSVRLLCSQTHGPRFFRDIYVINIDLRVYMIYDIYSIYICDKYRYLWYTISIIMIWKDWFVISNHIFSNFTPPQITFSRPVHNSVVVKATSLNGTEHTVEFNWVVTKTSKVGGGGGIAFQILLPRSYLILSFVIVFDFELFFYLIFFYYFSIFTPPQGQHLRLSHLDTRGAPFEAHQRSSPRTYRGRGWTRRVPLWIWGGDSVISNMYYSLSASILLLSSSIHHIININITIITIIIISSSSSLSSSSPSSSYHHHHNYHPPHHLGRPRR